jgi:hypothetical protein
MAANVYLQHYADGTQERHRRSTKQGRRPLPVELRQSRRITVNLTEQQYRQAVEQAERCGMKPAAYGALAMSLFDVELFAANNCSNT